MESENISEDAMGSSGHRGRRAAPDTGVAGGGGKVCGVCGDKALANNFGALTCETCKAFFRRNALKQETPRCVFESNCFIDKTTRRLCPACRLQKCFAIGMKPQLILDDTAKKARLTLQQKKRAEREEANQQGHGCCETMDTVDIVAPSNSSAAVSPAYTASFQPNIATSVSGVVQSLANTTISSAGTASSSGDVAQSPSGVAMFPVGSFTSQLDSATLSPSAAAVDLFFQQALAGLEPSSQEVRCPAPVAVELWAAPPVVLTQSGASSWSPYQSSWFPATQETCSPQQQPAPAARRQGGFSFQHVPRDDLPSDMKEYWQLTADERATLARLSSAYQDTIMKLTDRDPNRRIDPNSRGMSMDDYFNLMDEALRLCVRFAKALPEFRHLQQCDQISTLKSSSMQCYGIAASVLCVPERSVWTTHFGDLGQDHLPADLNSDPFIPDVFVFCTSLKSVAKTDIIIYSLLHCLILFDPRETTADDKHFLNTVKDKYLILLKHYLESEFSYQHADRYFGVLMDRLQRLRELNHQSVPFYKRFSAFFKPLGKEFYSH